MSSLTINGKSRDEIEAALAAPFDANDIKKDREGFDYIPIEKFQERLDTIVGRLNYDVEITSNETKPVGGKETVFITGAITLKYDDGSVCCKKTAVGGSEVIIVKDTGKAKSPASDFKSAYSDMFKACCKKLGIGESQLRALKPAKGNAGGNSNSRSSAEVTNETVTIGKFRKLGDKGWVSAGQIAGQDIEVMFWKQAIEAIEKRMVFDKFMTAYQGKTLHLLGTKGEYNGKAQFTVTGVPA